MARWLRHFKGRRALALGGLIAVVALTCGVVVADQRVKLTAAPLGKTPFAVVQKKAPAAPAALQARLDELAAAYGEPVGVAVTDVAQCWTAGVDQDRPYPQQSVSKLWV